MYSVERVNQSVMLQVWHLGLYAQSGIDIIQKKMCLQLNLEYIFETLALKLFKWLSYWDIHFLISIANTDLMVWSFELLEYLDMKLNI